MQLPAFFTEVVPLLNTLGLGVLGTGLVVFYRALVARSESLEQRLTEMKTAHDAVVEMMDKRAQDLDQRFEDEKKFRSLHRSLLEDAELHRERIKAWKDDELAVMQRRITDLLEEREQMRTTAGEIVKLRRAAGLTLEDNSAGRTLQEVAPAMVSRMEEMVGDVAAAVELGSGAAAASVTEEDVQAQLNLALGFLALGEWAQAIEIFDHHITDKTAAWELHLARAAAHANAHGGPASDLTALRGTDNAISLAGQRISPNQRAMLFSYRAAMLKRLGRLDEAEKDLSFARSLQPSPSVIADIDYNLACVYALQGNEERMLERIRLLESSPAHIGMVRSHFDDYFAAFRDNPAFLQYVERRVVRSAAAE